MAEFFHITYNVSISLVVQYNLQIYVFIAYNKIIINIIQEVDDY